MANTPIFAMPNQQMLTFCPVPSIYLFIQSMSLSSSKHLPIYLYHLSIIYLDFIYQLSIYLIFLAGVQPRWIQGIRRVDGVGVERLVYLLM